MKKDWKIKKLGEVCEIQLGKTPHRKTERFWDKEKKTSNIWLSIADMKHGKTLSDSKEYISDLGAENIKIIPKGTLMLSFKLTLGRVSFSGIDLYSNEAIASLINLSSDISSQYLYYYFTFFDWDDATKGDVKVKGRTLNKEKLKNLDLILPPLNEQQQIVVTLDKAFESIDTAKANAQQNLLNAKELFESYLQNVFENKGDDWVEKTVGDLGKPSMCKRILKEQTTTSGEIPFYKIGTFGKSPNAFISKELYKEYKTKYSFPKKGDILISASGTIGRRVIYDGKPAFFQDSNIVWIDNDEIQVLNEYLYHFYGFCDWQPEKGATISRLYNANLKRIKITFPKSLEEQKIVIQKIEALSIEIKKLEVIYQQKINDLEELKKSILQKAFSGELVK